MADNNKKKKKPAGILSFFPAFWFSVRAGEAEGSSQHSVLLARDTAVWTEIAQRAQRVASRLVSKDL